MKFFSIINSIIFNKSSHLSPCLPPHPNCSATTTSVVRRKPLWGSCSVWQSRKLIWATPTPTTRSPMLLVGSHAAGTFRLTSSGTTWLHLSSRTRRPRRQSPSSSSTSTWLTLRSNSRGRGGEDQPQNIK